MVVENRLASLCDSIAEGCVECGICQKNCRFLQKYGMPRQIALEWQGGEEGLQRSFECSLCWLCTAVCPKKIDPAAMFAAMRRQVVADGFPDFRKQAPLLRYERWGTSSLISWYGIPEGCKSVFFPGCALAGSRSGRVLELYAHMQRSIPDLGIVLDCCTKPSRDLGRQEYFTTMFAELHDTLFACGVREVLVACPSCYRVWKDHGDQVRVRSIYELLVETGPLHQVDRPVKIAVHDPCPTRFDPLLHQSVRELIASMGLSVREMKHHGRKTLCCGEGGAACYLVPDFSGNWTATRAREAEGDFMITYCAGCTHFLGKQASIGHVVDLYFEPEKTLAGRETKTVTPWTWFRRIGLKKSLKRLVPAGITGSRKKLRTAVSPE